MYRVWLDLTQEQMADRMGISRQAYIDLENGKTNPSCNTLESFRKAFKYDGNVLELFEKGANV